MTSVSLRNNEESFGLLHFLSFLVHELEIERTALNLRL